MLSDTWRNYLLELGVGKTARSTPTVYAGLFTTYPTSPSNAGVEGSGGSYARTAMSGLWASASGGIIANNAQVTITGNAQTYVGVGLWDASSSGNWIFASKLQTNITTSSPESIVLSSGIGLFANPIIGNVIVKDSSNVTTYTEGTDYFLQRDAGLIIRISTGGIGASDTLHASYNYPTTATLPTDGSQIFFPTGYLFEQLVGFRA